MFDEKKDYLVSTDYFYYILGKGRYNDDIKYFLIAFITDMQDYRRLFDSEFDYYIVTGRVLNELVKDFNLEEIEVVSKRKKLVREVI